VDSIVGGCSGPGTSVLLITSESSPFWSGIDTVVTKYQTASGADYFAFLCVADNLGSSAIGASLDIFAREAIPIVALQGFLEFYHIV
jgi:hypothetical protein